MSVLIDPRIAAASVLIERTHAIEARLQDDSRWPWVVLIPRCNAMELIDLDRKTSAALWCMVRRYSERLKTRPNVTKINVASLGNVVPQLHIHVVGRWPNDPAWPGPVCGVPGAQPYQPQERDDVIAALTTPPDGGSPT